MAQQSARPQEASGTSGMKATLNGVPSFSVVDGWWAEGHIEGVTGWSIGSSELAEVMRLSRCPLRQAGAGNCSHVLRTPQPLHRSDALAIALNGSFFNTQRMVLQYVTNAYKMQRDVAVPV